MKTALITPADIRYSYRGTEQLIFDYAKFLHEKGINTTLLISDMHIMTPHRKIQQPQERKDWNKVKHLYDKIPQKPLQTLKFVPPFGYSPVLLFKNLPQDSVLYMSENPHSYIFNILLKPKKQTYIVGLIGLLIRESHNPAKVIFNKVADLVLFKVLFKKKKIQDKVYYHVISNAQQEYLMKLGVSREKIFFIPPWIDTSKYKSKPTNDEKLRVIHIGGIDKSAATVVSTIKHFEEAGKLSRFEFYFIGRQQPEELDSYVAKYKNIHSLGRIEDAEKYRLLSKMDVVISPDYEGYSMAMVEGLASGLYVLASNRNIGALDVMGMGAEVWLAGDADDFTEALEHISLIKRQKKIFNERRQINIKVGRTYDKRVVLPQMQRMFENASKGIGNIQR